MAGSKDSDPACSAKRYGKPLADLGWVTTDKAERC